ncbi:hypothetical protein [Spiroplasma poulsonii]|uniref:hypothetical protein n=1 Tax=Spiroplasma poulsonii TaxID=2138 RepID=UPI001F4D1563|nr:hypothetical protein [Spiroplasma poulsonii]UNF62622.1 hypothetical protein MNU24_04015 [Spiroplasma poulsonii]
MKIFLIKTLIFNNLLVKALINDYFNDKNYYYWCHQKLQSNAQKKTKTILFWGKRKTGQEHKVIIEQETKNYCNKFSLGKNMIMLLFKESKSQF